MNALHPEAEAAMQKHEKRPLAAQFLFREWDDAIAQAHFRASLIGYRYRVNRTTGGAWCLTETTRMDGWHRG